MPFEPRILSNDDDGPVRPRGAAPVRPANVVRPAQDEFASPDLEVLAAQLSEDAAYLARLYPPRALPAPMIVRRRRPQGIPVARLRAAAALLLAGTLGVAGLWKLAGSEVSIWNGSHHADATSVAVLPEDATTAEAGHQPNKDSVASAPVAAADAETNHILIESENAGLEPGALLQELSVSEQEAVFDLLEAEPVQLARISL